jgi:hypothetical protein
MTTRRILETAGYIAATIVSWGILVVLATFLGFAAHGIVDGFRAGWEYW